MWYVNVDGKEGWLPSSILRIMNEEELGGSATSSPSRTKLSSHGTSADASDFSDSDGKSLMIPSDCTLESDLIRLHGFFFFFFFFLLPLEPGVSSPSLHLPVPRSLPPQRQRRTSSPMTYPKQTSLPETMAWSRKISLGAMSDSELLDRTPVDSREYPCTPWTHQPNSILLPL